MNSVLSMGTTTFLAISLILVSRCDSSPPSPGHLSLLQQPLVNGSISEKFAAVGLLSLEHPADTGLCTATLVAPDQILTAAHCVADGPVDFDAREGSHQLYFSLGMDPELTRIQRRLIQVEIHPEYDPNREEPLHDLAIAWLDQPIAEVLPAALYTDPAASLLNQELCIVGYGLAEVTGTTWPPKPSASLGGRRATTVLAHDLSSSHWHYHFSNGDTGACFGDSGGPAFFGADDLRRIAGVTSYGDSTCKEIGAYVRLDIHKDWLQRLIPQLNGSTTNCLNDGMCNGACAEDSDCASLMCPPGVCGESDNGCLPVLATAAGTACHYVSADAQVCASSTIIDVQYDEELGHCIHYDRLGTPCHETCADCGTLTCTCNRLLSQLDNLSVEK